MSAEQLYPFATGDRLDQRNTYFYVPFCGHEFLAAWKMGRDDALLDLGAPIMWEFSETDEIPALPFLTASALDSLYKSLRSDPANPMAQALLKKLLQKFEVSKRLYSSYDEGFRAAEGAVYNQLSLYVAFAHLLELGYATTGGLYFLNGLLKVNDTLVGARQILTEREGSALAWLLSRELKHVQYLAAQQGITV